MKRNWLLIACFITAFSVAKSQVINIESKRFLNDSNGLVGKMELNYNIIQNVQKLSVLGINIHAQYKGKKFRLLTISDLAFIKSGKQDFTNSGYQHIRYNYKLAKKITLEAFIQAQYNRVLKLDRRYLFGSGPRFRLVKSAPVKLYVACLYMYEYQSRNNDSLHSFNHRASSYFTFNLDYSRVDFSLTFFYQPNLQELADYRLAGDAVFELELNKKLDFKTGINLLFDTRQPPGVPALTYLVKNGIIVKF